MPEIALGLVEYIVFLLGATLHEAAHAWAALRGGDPTAYHGGQVSLSPWPHIRREPFGMVILPLICVVISGWPLGFASAPYDPFWAMRYPKRAAWMALAGPVANLFLAALAFVALRIGLMSGTFGAPDAVEFGELVSCPAGGLWSAIGTFLSIWFSLNLLLGLFNLMPVPPLDGSAVVPLLLDDRTTERYQQFIWSTPAFSVIGIIIVWQVFGYVFHPIWLFTVNLLHPTAHYG